MNNKIYMSDLNEYKGQKITVSGFVDNIKDLKCVQFLILRDHSGRIQVTIEKNDENKQMNEIVKSLTIDSTLDVEGVLNDAPGVRLNGMELIPSKIKITSVADELPLNYKEKSISRSVRHDYRHLDLRTERNYKIFQIETCFENALRQYCIKNGFIELHSPKITAKAAESGSEVFKMNFFGQDAALAQSPQFYKQMAMASGFDKVFEIGPAFRAENSNTSYHASEINMCDVEMSWVHDISEIEDFEEEFLKYAFEELNSKYGNTITHDFNSSLVNVDAVIPRVNFFEAKKILRNNYHYVGDRKTDFDRKEELLLGKYALENYKSDFIFVENFPFDSRAFYQKVDEKGNTKSYDLLYRGLEVTTGALREHNPDQLMNQVVQKGINPDDLQAYIELFKYGCPPHGGYGLGLSRVLMKTLSIDNIMDTNFIYRGPSRKLKL